MFIQKLLLTGKWPCDHLSSFLRLYYVVLVQKLLLTGEWRCDHLSSKYMWDLFPKVSNSIKIVFFKLIKCGW